MGRRQSQRARRRDECQATQVVPGGSEGEQDDDKVTMALNSFTGIAEVKAKSRNWGKQVGLPPVSCVVAESTEVRHKLESGQGRCFIVGRLLSKIICPQKLKQTATTGPSNSTHS